MARQFEIKFSSVKFNKIYLYVLELFYVFGQRDSQPLRGVANVLTSGNSFFIKAVQHLYSNHRYGSNGPENP